MGCMRDLSTVRGHIPELRPAGMDVILLGIHESPGRELLGRFEFEFTPLYLMFDSGGTEIFRSHDLPSVSNIIEIADKEKE